MKQCIKLARFAVVLASILPAARAGILQTDVSIFTYDRANPADQPTFLSFSDSHAGTASVQDSMGNLISIGGGYADATAKAAYGTLKAQAKSYEPFGALGETSALAQSITEDTILVVDPTRNFGDPVNLLFSLAVDSASRSRPIRSVEASPYACGLSCAFAIYSLQIGGGPSIAYQWNEAVHSPDVQTLTVSTTVGATLLFSYQLDVGTYTFDSTGYPIPYNSYDVNFLDTTSLFIDPQSPSTQLQSASGFNYASPASSSAVPEPSSWILTAPLLGLVCRFARRRRRA